MKNKYLIAMAAVGLHICIGSVYAWSVFTKPVMQALGISMKEVSWAFSLAIFFLGMSAAFLGKYVEKYGPRKSGIASAVFFGAGLIGSGIAIKLHSLELLYLSYGVIGGIGLGIGYITPVSTLVKWFPDNKGFATGLAIMGFGFSALIAAPVAQWLITEISLPFCFIFMGLAYFAIMYKSASYLAPPDIMEETLTTVDKNLPEKAQLTAAEAMQSWYFYALWVVFFLNISCGIGILAVASPFAQSEVGMTPIQAATMVGLIGLVNGIGRLLWSSFSDYCGRINIFGIFFAIEAFDYYGLASTSSQFMFQVYILLIVSCYGGAFATMPALLSDIFGSKQLSAIHGRILSAWAMAGIAGPLIISSAQEYADGYSIALMLFSASMVFAFLMMFVIKVIQVIDRKEVVIDESTNL